MAKIALVTTYLSDYRLPLYRLLAERHGLEVLCYGRGGRYVSAWFGDLDASWRPPTSRRGGSTAPPRRSALGRDYDAVIAPFAGGSMLPAAYRGRPALRAPFVLWASVWHQPRSLVHALSLPVTRHIYRHADAVLAYGEHVRHFVAGIRGRDDDVFVAPQTVEPALFRRPVSDDEVPAFRERHRLGDGPLVLYVGRAVPEKGSEVLAAAWPLVRQAATLVMIGDGPASAQARLASERLLGPLPRAELPAAYRAARWRCCRRSRRPGSRSRGAWSATRRWSRAARWWPRPRSERSPADWSVTARHGLVVAPGGPGGAGRRDRPPAVRHGAA